MENFEDDDDTHFCNKCHATINGLENYVRHRQSGCRTNDDCKSEVYNCQPSTPTVSYPEILNADAFFSSLELQSSAKPHPRRSTDLLGSRLRRSCRHEERKKRQRKDKSPEDKEETKANLLPVVADLDDLGIPSLVGFPEIVSTSSTTNTGKPTTSGTIASGKPASPAPRTSKAGKHESTTADQKHQQEDNQRRLDQDQNSSDWLEDTILTDLDVNNETKEDTDDVHLDRYADYDYQRDDDSDDDTSDVDIVEEDSFAESEDPDTRDTHDTPDSQDPPEAPDPPDVPDTSGAPDNTRFPPQTHTGGKWRPGDNVKEEVPLNEDEPEVEDVEQSSQHPPPGHTGGKWRPTESSAQKSDEHNESKDVSGQPPQPPPGHTRGKWVPGADIGTGYWCSPCGRKLASRLVYNRHLLSALHARRSIQEIDGAAQMPRGAAPLLHRPNLSQRQKILATKRGNESSEPQGSEGGEPSRKRLRRREKEVLFCEMCKARVRRAQMGKHLLSHYHCRVAGANPSGAKARRFLLENMANIVRQCPFQCASCRFYCNTEDTFLRHWRSDAHKDTVSKIEGNYVCALCDFWCDDNESVEAHIMKQGHQDVVSMINGSVPIVIRRQLVLACSTCCRRFRYNMQLRVHAKETGHKVDVTASDEYQRRMTCSICGQILRSLISLQRHQLACHRLGSESTSESLSNVSPYFCSFCSMNFKTAAEAVLHRRTPSHKETARKKRDAESSTFIRSCPHCQEVHANLVQHRHHLLQKHSELCHRCAKCGKLFALSQDVTKHTRENSCSQENKEKNKEKSSTSAKQWECTDCTFATESEAEFLFHRVLHDGPANPDTSKEESSNSKGDRTAAAMAPKYPCPRCKGVFAKSTMRDHLRKHTGEKPFPCPKCQTAFARRSSVNVHLRDCIGGRPAPLAEIEQVNNVRQRKYVCGECNDAFHTKHTLRQHMLRHDGKPYKCGLPGCPTVLRTATELKHHRRIVHENRFKRQFQCDDCSYAGKTKTQLISHRKMHDPDDDDELYTCQYRGCSFQSKLSSHLKRHARLHTGKKPYKCRHCRYASNNLENLRKHVLSTNLHPGKTIYECKSCVSGVPYETNFSRELRAHLLQFHPKEYQTPEDAIRHVASLFDVDGPSTSDNR